MSNLILIINRDGDRLCRDGRWRDFANFGTESSCVKTYKQRDAAKRMAHRVWGRVVVVPSGNASVKRHVEAGGLVVESHSIPNKPGYEKIFHAALSDFVVA